jgi:predicted RNase H-like nuclease
MRLIGGADGCRGGWFLVTKDLDLGHISCQICPSTKDLLHKTKSLEILALDIPIGLPDKDS